MVELSNVRLMEAYRSMRTIRVFEDRLALEAATTAMVGPLHLYCGEEACAVGVCMNLDERDRVYSTHRPHGHCIARGVDVKAMMLEIYGRVGGICNGKGGSMHLADPDRGFMGASGIVAGAIPLVCGAALAAKTLNTGGVAVGFVGDGGSNQGQFLESLNFASVFKLPAIFVIEDNGFAETIASSWACAGDHVKRAEGFGMTGRKVDGFDLYEVYDAVHEAVSRARKGEGPSLLDVKLERFYPHEQGISDAMRLPGHVEWLKEHSDCLKLLKAKMLATPGITEAELAAVDREVEALVDGAVRDSNAAPMVPVSELMTDVYVSYP
jgi:acetoin:2,6-dichlorophenolindophenol oxidoreductase subunit alpha